MKSTHDLVKSNTLKHNILGEIIFRRPVNFVITYTDRVVNVHDVVKFRAMKTGCCVLTSSRNAVFIMSSSPLYYQYQEEVLHG